MPPYSVKPERNSSAPAAEKDETRNRRTSIRAFGPRRRARRVKAISSAAPATSGTITEGRRKDPLTWDRAKTIAAMPGETRARPVTSRRAWRLPGNAGMRNPASSRPSTQNGTLTQKIQRQERCSTIRPPISGPRIGPSTTGSEIRATALPRIAPSAAWTSSVVSTGSIRPPPRPWTTRQAISSVALPASEAPIEPTRKTVRAIIQMRLPPKRSSSQPVTGTAAPRASR
jgi:hypothetical protein